MGWEGGGAGGQGGGGGGDLYTEIVVSDLRVDMHRTKR